MSSLMPCISTRLDKSYAMYFLINFFSPIKAVWWRHNFYSTGTYGFNCNLSSVYLISEVVSETCQLHYGHWLDICPYNGCFATFWRFRLQKICRYTWIFQQVRIIMYWKNQWLITVCLPFETGDGVSLGYGKDNYSYLK